MHADEITPHVMRLLFKVSGPDHMGVYFSPKQGVKLLTWSFSEGELLEGPVWKDDRPTYYIFVSHGLSPSPWTFWLDFQVSVPSLIMKFVRLAACSVTQRSPF
jgi:hypothetical protein